MEDEIYPFIFHVGLVSILSVQQISKAEQYNLVNCNFLNGEDPTALALYRWSSHCPDNARFANLTHKFIEFN